MYSYSYRTQIFNTFMKKLFPIFSLVILSITLITTSCTKEEDPALPLITFSSASGYVSTHTGAKFGDTLRFNVTAQSNGISNLVKFQVLASGQQVLDSTINKPTFTIDLKIVKGISDKEVWKFVTTDIAGNTKADSIVITGNFGEILTHSSVILGAQNNTVEKSFISFSAGAATLYLQAAAFGNQSAIDMFCFYENTASNANMMSLAAPGSNIKGIFTGTTSPDLYATKNVTFFVKTTLTAAQFDAVKNDAVVLASFNPKNQFKKAKVLTAGDVYAFKLQSGKCGLYKVVATEGTESGTLKMDVKIQK